MGITRSESNEERNNAMRVLNKRKSADKGKKFIKVPHPSGIRNTFILKEAKE